MNEPQGNKTGTGIQPNLAALLCYVAGWITGIVFLIIEKDNKVIRFHAVQSIVVFGALNILAVVIGFIPVINLIFGWVIGVVAFILWILLMYRAYQGQMWKVPIAGNIAEQQSNPKK